MPNYDQPGQNRDGMRKALVALPDELWPNRVALACFVRRSRVECNSSGEVLLNATTTAETGVSLYSAWALREQRLDAVHGTWVLGAIKNAEAPGEDMVFVFHPPVSAADRLTPVFTELVTAQHYWHPVLRDANVVVQLRNIGGGDEYFPIVRRFYHKGYQLNTTFKRRVYVSTTPWSAASLVCDEPLPTPVSVDAFGVSIDLGECLHPTLEVESPDRADAVVYDLVPTLSDEKITSQRALAATNHTGWQPHIARIETRTVDGLHFRITYEALPPREPALSVQ